MPSRDYSEITYTAPLSPPMEIDAYWAPSDSDWRVFVFPGTPSNKLLFTRFMRIAPDDIEFIVISRPGFAKGHSQPILPFEEQIAAIQPFLDEKKTIALGVSYGGELALKAALTYPQNIRGVVTVAALIDEPHDYALTLERLGGAGGVEDFVPDRWRKVRAEIAGRRSQIGPLLSELAHLRSPVEVLHGDFDAIVPKSNSETLMRVLEPQARARLEIIQGGTHYLELQYPRRIHDAVRRVIERIEKPTNSPAYLKSHSLAQSNAQKAERIVEDG